MFFSLFKVSNLRCSLSLAIISIFAGVLLLNADTKEVNKKAQACVIWMHGLGADSTDMMGLAEQLNLDAIHLRHVFLDAPSRPVTLNGGMVMPAWYDIYGLQFVDREDTAGIEESEGMIRKAMEAEMGNGFRLDQIFLAGFSQGGAMALHTGLNTKGRLGGIIALSAYLPLARHQQPKLDVSTPIFMGSGKFDPLVLPKWTEQSKDWLTQKGYRQLTFHQYPMEHSVCFEELKDISLWLYEKVQGASQ